LVSEELGDSVASHDQLFAAAATGKSPGEAAGSDEAGVEDIVAKYPKHGVALSANYHLRTRRRIMPCEQCDNLVRRGI
jgi:hypothetical protein